MSSPYQTSRRRPDGVRSEVSPHRAPVLHGFGGGRRSTVGGGVGDGPVAPLRDRQDTRWSALVILILVLSAVDGMLTLTLLARGTAAEANPFMAGLLGADRAEFVLWKLGLTAGGAITLAALARRPVFGRFRVGSLLYLMLFMYTALVGYEIAMLPA